jgi:hypothetical protein
MAIVLDDVGIFNMAFKKAGKRDKYGRKVESGFGFLWKIRFG